MKKPISMDPSHGNLLVVGDGGKDPAAEEYVYSPPGSKIIVAPKMSKNEKPSMSNAIIAIANTALKGKAKAARAASGAMSVQGGTPVNGVSISNKYAASGGGSRPLSPGAGSTAMTMTPTGSTVISPATTIEVPGYSYNPTGAQASVKMGEGRDVASLLDTIAQDFGDSNKFAARPGFGFAAAGAVIDKLKKAAAGGATMPILSPGGMVTGYQTNTGPSASAADSISAYEKAQLDLQKQQLSSQSQAQRAQTAQAAAALAAQQAYWEASTGNQRYATDVNAGTSRYATDAQKAIAEMNMRAQMQQLAAQNKYNTERLALERMLGTGQLELDTKRAAQEAMQLLMTRAGRQMVAPGGNVIPSMQPLIGRSIN